MWLTPITAERDRDGEAERQRKIRPSVHPKLGPDRRYYLNFLSVLFHPFVERILGNIKKWPEKKENKLKISHSLSGMKEFQKL